MTCPTCGQSRETTHAHFTPATSDGTGLDKTRLEAAALDICRERDHDHAFTLERPCSACLVLAEGAFRAYLDHTEETR